jgi:methionyl-tRNA formyltransferase
MEKKPLKFAYFAGEPLGVPVADILVDHGLVPALVVCNPDRPKGRGRTLTPPPMKLWADEHGVPTIQPMSVRERAALPDLTATKWDVFVVVAYNHILPEWLITLPRHGTLNLHPSLLPKLRGPSPIRTAILEDQPEAVGVSVMQMDTKMDHGPIIRQKTYQLPSGQWPPDGQELDQALAEEGGECLAECLSELATGTSLTATPQDHAQATYTKKLTRDMGELPLDPHNLPTGEAAVAMLRKICGLSGWPGTHFFYNDKRIKVHGAHLTPAGTLTLEAVTPEGQSAVVFADWLQRQRV